MFEWIENILAKIAYDAAIYSVDCASHNGLYQMEEPQELKNLAATK